MSCFGALAVVAGAVVAGAAGAFAGSAANAVAVTRVAIRVAIVFISSFLLVSVHNYHCTYIYNAAGL
jgi:hypothetical protein